MTVLPDELVFEIVRHLERKNLKLARNVSRQWYRVATLLLFEHVLVYRHESLKRLKGILSQAHISRSIKEISVEPADGSEDSVISLTVNPDMLWILHLPTSCYIHHYQTSCVTRLASFNSKRDGEVAPMLEEIRIQTSDIPYLATSLFRNLRKFHINADSVQLSDRITLPLLEELHITSNTVGVDLLIGFVRRHGKLQQLCLALEMRLGPLKDGILSSLESILRTKLSDDVVTSIIANAKRDALGEMQLMLKSLHRQITEMFDEELVKELNQEFVSIFREWKEVEYNKNSIIWKDIRSAVQNPEARIAISMEYQEGELPAFEA
ncbi:hypothetical protein V490_00662 [Pseudogymnoascus sp. VKM F-3557]|nr:hypothetical protein V490_00662 [Pseudogymnoascus sp. VKM F-3557]